MLILTLTTLVAVALAFAQYSGLKQSTPVNDVWQWAHIGFLVAMMGWMPAPIEVSAWNSAWLLEKQKTQTITPKQALFDFNLGYITTAILAVVFLALGALIMYGSGEQFSDSGGRFAAQLINLYGQALGNEAKYLIGVVALLCIFSTTVTVIDGYSRTLEMSWQLLAKTAPSPKRHNGIMISICALGLMLIFFFQGALLPLLEFVMILAFMTTVIFAWLNYRLMTSEQLPIEHRYQKGMKVLSWFGLAYLGLFALLFLYWYATK